MLICFKVRYFVAVLGCELNLCLVSQTVKNQRLED